MSMARFKPLRFAFGALLCLQLKGYTVFQSYIALAKGALVPEHILICPIQHHQSVPCSPDDVIEEMNKLVKFRTVYFASNLSKFYHT